MIKGGDFATALERSHVAAEKNLHLAVMTHPKSLVEAYWLTVQFNCSAITCLRSCLMKSEDLYWIDKI